MYLKMRGDMAKVPWRKLFYSNVARPQAVFIVWLGSLGCLPTKDMLVRFRLLIDKTCALCGNDESMSHLFFECTQPCMLWQRVLTVLNIDHVPRKWEDEPQWIIFATRHKGLQGKLLKLAFIDLVYGIWQGRNSLIFKQQLWPALLRV